MWHIHFVYIYKNMCLHVKPKGRGDLWIYKQHMFKCSVRIHAHNRRHEVSEDVRYE